MFLHYIAGFGQASGDWYIPFIRNEMELTLDEKLEHSLTQYIQNCI